MSRNFSMTARLLYYLTIIYQTCAYGYNIGKCTHTLGKKLHLSQSKVSVQCRAPYYEQLIKEETVVFSGNGG